MTRVLSGVTVVGGAFVLCAGIPLGVLYLLARLGWSFLPSLLLGLALGPPAMFALGTGLRRLDEEGVLLEASIVFAVIATIVGLAVRLVFFSHGGGSFGPFPD